MKADHLIQRLGLKKLPGEGGYYKETYRSDETAGEDRSLSTAIYYLQLTLIASALYRILGVRAGKGFETARTKTIFSKLVRTRAAVEITEDEIVVKLDRRANNPYLLAGGYGKIAEPIPWLENKVLRIAF